ncbi:acyl carrier protein-like [Dioscorea cayenensis subsp. rotundata]|uniref:Acyl carrier protein n=1 Tax=Dioscorea cayennensis subsp. rotundata TaxID=55577 RepID=A0AB40AXT1_DIOCR|nr:acyl carrier protein-like [Dioscorea cayenensis subsp. rotundata]
MAGNIFCSLISSVRPQTTTHFAPRVHFAGGLRLASRIGFQNSSAKGCYKTSISCSISMAETLQVVQSTIAKQLSIEESTVTPLTKFADLGADSLDTVEIMMALEEQFEVSIGEDGAQVIVTVQDAVDLIEKVKAEKEHMRTSPIKMRELK